MLRHANHDLILRQFRRKVDHAACWPAGQFLKTARMVDTSTRHEPGSRKAAVIQPLIAKRLSDAFDSS